MTDAPSPPEPIPAPPAEEAVVVADAGEASDRRARLAALVKRAVTWLPWLSLVLGILGASLMDRSPKAAKLVIPGVLLGWAAVIGFALLARVDADRFQGWRSRWIKVAQLSVLIAMQSLMQQSLFFSLPFYLRAAALTLPHVTFVVVLLSAAAVTLWDPLYERVVALPGARLSMQALGAFASVNALLPALGLSNRWALFLGGAAGGLAIPLHLFVTHQSEARAKLAGRAALVSCVVGPVLLVVFGAPFIPPAPLRLAEGGIGTGYRDHTLLGAGDVIAAHPDALVCATAIAAPHGVKDELSHVWKKDGRTRDRIPLVVKGGRKEGFRTYSKKAKLGKDPSGEWTCIVETSLGQQLGQVSATVLAGTQAPAPESAASPSGSKDSPDE